MTFFISIKKNSLAKDSECFFFSPQLQSKYYANYNKKFTIRVCTKVKSKTGGAPAYCCNNNKIN